jgi:hypothetical protein
MSVRTLLLVLSTTTLSVLTACGTTQTASREGPPPPQAEGELKGCSCALRAQGQDDSEQAAAGKVCRCLHCATGGTSEGKGVPCYCAHHGKGDQAQARDSEH